MVFNDLTQDTVDQSHVLGGFSQSVEFLEFNQIRRQVASYAHTLMGQDSARNLMPDRDLLEIATRQQETTESRQFLEQGGSLEFGPQEDFQEYVQRALLGGLLRGDELYPIHDLVRAAGYDRSNLSRHEELPLLSSYAENIPDHSSLQRAIGAAISPAGEVLDDAIPTLSEIRHESRRIQQNLN